MQVTIELILVLAVNIIAVGISWGSLRTRVSALERVLQNGLTEKVHNIETCVEVIKATCKMRAARASCHADIETPDKEA